MEHGKSALLKLDHFLEDMSPDGGDKEWKTHTGELSSEIREFLTNALLERGWNSEFKTILKIWPVKK